MGALHEGHLSLVDAARAECDLAVVTIFVNPTQFGPGEDFRRYPRDLERDLSLLGERGCDLVFAPQRRRDVSARPRDVCRCRAARPGAGRRVSADAFSRRGHVVLKLFQLAPADRAYFGRKDYQQTLVVRQMVADLNVPIDVRVCPIVREPDGLAMSSRNAYLSPDERQRALALSRSLRLAERLVAEGERDVAAIRQQMLREIESHGRRRRSIHRLRRRRHGDAGRTDRRPDDRRPRRHGRQDAVD